MKFPNPVSAAWVAQLIHAEVIGDSALQATGINELHCVQKGDIVFVDHPKYYEAGLKSNASIIIINTNKFSPPEGKTLLITSSPFDGYLAIVNYFRPFIQAQQPISETASVGSNTILSPHIFIGREVKIGNNCIIHPNVTIGDYSEIGNNVIIQAGTVIGSDAFYYNTNKQQPLWYRKMQSCGNVVIEDFVEIGAGCTIDRGVTASTIIGSGTKIDNMVHIGHDTIIGKNCLLAAQVGIAGAVVIEDGVVLWGQVGVSKTLTIGKNAVVLAQSGVPSSLKPNKTYFGYPAEEAFSKKRELAWIKRIPEIWEKLKKS